MRILISTIPGDEHACAISCALKLRGHSVDLFFPSDFPAQQNINLAVSKYGENIKIENAHDPINLTSYECGIIRRTRSPNLSHQLHPSDRTFAINQAQIVLDAVTSFIPNTGFWINPPASKERADRQ